jgi:tetratricopeptide (TPR) repeat protein
MLLFCGPVTRAEIQPADTATIDQLYMKSKTFWYSNIDSSIYYLKQVEELSKKIDYLRGIGYAFYGYGRHETVLYKRFQYLNRANELFKSAHEKSGTGNALLLIGNVYQQIGQGEKSLEYYKQSLVVKKEVSDFGGIALALISIGLHHQLKGELDVALENFEQSLVYRRKEGTPHGIAYAQVNIADVLLTKGKADQAHVMADSAVQNFFLTTDLVGQVWALRVKGQALLKLDHPEEAERIFQTIENNSDVQYNENVLQAKRELIALYSKKGELSKAFQLQSNYLTLRDTLASRDYRIETQRVVNEYEFKSAAQETQRQKEIEEEQIARRNNIQYLIIVVFVLIVFVILFSGKKMFTARLINSFLFIGLLLLFEFLLVVTGPGVESFTQGEPFLKLLANIVLTLLVLPVHQFLERFSKKRLLAYKAVEPT